MSDDFLSRWSRRKRGLAPSKQPILAPEAVEESLSPEEIAALPSLDSLGPDSDLLAFLKKGVPAALRNAALRKAWAIDPKIRDYVSEALDYAYDWNVPGGVPGNGPLLPGDDVAGMVDRIVGRVADAPVQAEAGTRQSEAEAWLETEKPAPSGLSEKEPAPLPAGDPVRLSGPLEPVEPAFEADAVHEEAVPEPMPRRRHGSARPI